MTSSRITYSSTQVGQRLGINNGAVLKLAHGGYLTNLNHEEGKRKMAAFGAKDVQFLVRFYAKKGKDWKKAYAAAKANPEAPLPSAPRHLDPRRPDLSVIKPAPNAAGVMTRLSSIEASIAEMKAAIAKLLAVWS